MRTLITGSLAFDTITIFEDSFKNHILPDQIHILNVSFFTPQMKRHLGGCSGNIGYNLKMLGGDPVIMATVGQDFGPYRRWLEQHGLFSEHITLIPDEFTAQALITTDIDHNQINAFHPGAMNMAHQNKVSDAADIGLGIVSPNGRDAMVEHAADFAKAGIPFVFDPGQQLPLFGAEDLQQFMQQATYAIFNDYEAQMVADKTGNSLQELALMVDALIVTKGAQGSTVYVDGNTVDVDAAPISKALDPTGCGDAYRAGVLFGIANGDDWKTCAQLGGLCGAIKIEHEGTQNHSFTKAEFDARYASAYGESLN